jgi:hypothetical protein
MKNLALFSFAMMLLFVGCRKNPTDNVSKDALELKAAKEKLIAMIKEHDLPPRMSLVADPANQSKVKSRGKTRYGLLSNHDFNYYQSLIKQAIDPGDYECEPTMFDEYIFNSVQTWDDNDFTFYFFFGAIVFDYVYIYENTDGGQYYGATGLYTNVTNRTFKDLKKFWDIPTDILMRDAHGSVYSDVNKVSDVLLVYSDFGILWPMTEEEALELAGLIKTVFGSSHFMNYNHPLLTLNAFAAMEDPYFGTPKKIVMGDGILKAYDDMGYSDVASAAILAHEYAHHIQFANNVEFVFEPEGTRRTELMADALAAYFLTHKIGAAMNWKRVQGFLQVFYAIGDCAFDNPGHHGTPNQRMMAASYGYALATDAQKKGMVMSSEDLITWFDTVLPTIIASDN